MTELKEKNLYPSLPDSRESPSAPAIDDRGHSHRLKVITDVLNFLEEESSKREAFSKKYFRLAKYVGVVDSVLIGATVCAEVVVAALLASGVGSPFALGLGVSGAAVGAISLFGNIVVRKTTIRAEKHLKIKTLASAKLDTIASHVSKALVDDFISDEEFKLIMEELNKYKAMKEEIRNNTKKKLKEEEKESLIERGRQEARESFKPLKESIESIPKAITFLAFPSIAMSKEELIKLGPIATEALKKPFKKEGFDLSYGLYAKSIGDGKNSKFYIGDKPVLIEDNNIIVDGEKYEGTRGLWELILSKDPQNITDEDLNNYGRLMIKTNPLHRNNDPKEPIRKRPAQKNGNIFLETFGITAKSIQEVVLPLLSLAIPTRW